MNLVRLYYLGVDDKKSNDFSLVLGGPLYQAYLRFRLATPPLDWAPRRIIAITAIAWLPLLALSLIDGTFYGTTTSFVKDVSAHVRFLIAIPLLVAAELVAHSNLRISVRHFLDANIIAKEDEPQFEAAVFSAVRWRNSVFVEVILLVLALTLGHWLWREHISLHQATWYAQGPENGRELTLPGYWYAFVSLPIFRFLLSRWGYRIFLWHRFLWQVSRLRLNLNALHPDRAGGLGFLGISSLAFVPVLLAVMAMISAQIGDYIWREGASLMSYKMEIAGFIFVILLCVLVSQLFFIPQLLTSRNASKFEYDTFVGRYMDDFERKWLTKEGDKRKDLLGSSDIQSLADIANSYSIVQKMRLLPIGWDDFMRLVLALLLPLIPLVLTIIPLSEILKRFVKVLG